MSPKLRRLSDYGSVAIVASFAALFCFRLWTVYASAPSARVFHDTELYFRLARSSVFSSDIWVGERAAAPLLWFKACALDAERIRRSLTIFSAFSWIALACSAWLTIASGLARAVGPALILSVASTLNVLQWNDVVLSESLSHSCWALFTAAALLYLSRRGYWAITLCLSAAMLALCRDSNAYFVLFCGILTMAAAVNRARRGVPWRTDAIVGLVCIVIFGLSNASANAGGRWEYSLRNIIVTRILPNEQVVAEFESQGMPVTGALRPGRPRRAYDRDPRLEAFNDWLTKRGKRAYIHYLFAHPISTLVAPELSVVLGGDLDQYQPRRVGNERTFLDAVWSKQLWLWHFALVVLVGSVAAIFRPLSAPVVLGLAYALLLFPHAVLIWHADSMEVARHGAPVSLQLQLALVLLVIGALEGTERRLMRHLPWLQGERIKS